jgi:hypothetical protein
MTTLRARTSTAAIVFALSVFTGLMTSEDAGPIINVRKARAVALANRGYNMSQTFDWLVEECVQESKSSFENQPMTTPFLTLLNEQPATSSNRQASNALIVRGANTGHLNQLKNELAQGNRPRMLRISDVVWSAVHTVYLVLRQLFQKARETLEGGQLETLGALFSKIPAVFLQFIYRLFVKLLTAVAQTLRGVKAANKAPMINSQSFWKNNAPPPNNAPPRNNASSPYSELGNMVVSVLVVKQRLGDELQGLKTRLDTNLQLLQSAAKYAAATGNKTLNDQIVDLSKSVGTNQKRFNLLKKEKASAKQFLSKAAKLQADLDNLSKAAKLQADLDNLSKAAKLQADLEKLGRPNARTKIPKDLLEVLVALRLLYEASYRK